MENIIKTIKEKYYRYNPGEFLPVYEGSDWINKRDFHHYRIRQILGHPAEALHYFTHYGSAV